MDTTSYLLGKKNGGVAPTGNIDITANGVYNVGRYATADVQVPEANLQSKTETISTNTTTTIQADEGYDGLSSVEVTTNIPQPSGTINITENGTHDVTNYASANVSVEPSYNITSIAQANAEITKIGKALDDYYLSIPNMYPTLSDNNITLYTPNINYKNYIIYKNSDNKYGIVWCGKAGTLDAKGFYIDNNAELSILRTIGTATYGQYTTQYQDVTLKYGVAVYGYFSKSSNVYDTIEECINAIETSSTPYSKINNSNIPSIIELYYSNAPTMNDNGAIILTKLSSNETIVGQS